MAEHESAPRPLGLIVFILVSKLQTDVRGYQAISGGKQRLIAFAGILGYFFTGPRP
jgi:hypothetical protein